MATIAAQQLVEPSFEHGQPRGLWAVLARAADAPALGSGDIWRGLDRRLLTSGKPNATGLWDTLAQHVDPAQYCPRAVPDVAEEQIVEGDHDRAGLQNAMECLDEAAPLAVPEMRPPEARKNAGEAALA